MTAKTILATFDMYKKARMTFVQTVAELALRPQHVQVLLDAKVLEHLKPLLDDVCVQVQQCAAIALGRIAHHSARVSDDAVNNGLLVTLLQHLDTKGVYYRRAAMFVLRSVCQHNVAATERIVLTPGCGAVEALMLCLVDLDTSVREAAAWAAGYIARHGPHLARAIVDAGAVPHLVLCMQEPELTVRRVCVGALADIARHEPDLAHVVVNAGAVAHLARATADRDDTLRRQALLALAVISRHSYNFAEIVVQADIFPDVLLLMNHRCPLVRRNAAMLVRDVVKHTAELAQLVVNTGGVGALIGALRFTNTNTNNGGHQPAGTHSDENDHRIPATAALGYIAGHSAQLAHCVENCDGVAAVHEVLRVAPVDSELLAVCVWCLGQVGRHSPEPVAASGVLARLLQYAVRPDVTEELRSRCYTTLRQCIQGCTALPALAPLLNEAPPDILNYVLAQLSKLLPVDPRARRLFVTTGGLKRIQEIEAEPGSAILEYITLINACFPEEIVRYYTPGYPNVLLEKVEQYRPAMGSTGVGADDTDELVPGPCSQSSRELDILFHD